MSEIQIKLTSPLLNQAPSYATDGAAALDLRACIAAPQVLEPNQTTVIGAGFALNIADPNIAAIILPRSGLGIKDGIVLSNLTGLIDSDYQGEVFIGVWNRSETPFMIEPQNRIAQMIFVPILRPALSLVDSFKTTSQRGENGIGSTGVV